MVKLTSHGPLAFVNSIKLGVDGSKNKTIRNLFSFLSVVNSSWIPFLHELILTLKLRADEFVNC
jgi:hypothetical protein